MQIKNTWEEKKKKSFEFPVVCTPKSKRLQIQRIHPLKQREVDRINRTFSGDERITAIVIFGSAANIRCHRGSDLDMVIRMEPEDNTIENRNEISERIQEICNWRADILWYDRLSEKDRVFRDVKRGVQIV